jgi:outer membrane receptor protein involved in Fe transport
MPGLLCGLLALAGALEAQSAKPDAVAAWQGRAVADVLDELRERGVPLVYSTNLVPRGLRVRTEPHGEDAVERVRAVLRPHGLVLAEVEGLYLVMRTGDAPAASAGAARLLVVVQPLLPLPPGEHARITAQPPIPRGREIADGVHEFRNLAPGSYAIEVRAPGHRPARREVELGPGQAVSVRFELAAGPAQLETLSVSASRYILFSNSQFFIDQRAIQALPDLGEDPLRSAHRLPGMAAGGLSSRAHFRGGEHNETAIYLNGLQLLDPFHIRDYHNIFSTIDARAIAGVEAYTGGFPANYGDSMSGVLLLDSQRPDRPRRTELGLSVYNTSALFSGFNEAGTVDWLLTARRSNLDLILNDDLGKPDYFDVFAEIGWDLSDRSRLSLNALYAEDRVVVVTESDPAELERSDSRTRNRHLWLLLDTRWSAALASATVLSSSRLENLREAEVNDPEQLVGAIRDDRDASVTGLRQDWRYTLAASHVLRWGFEFERLETTYGYASQAEYFGLFEAWPGIENPRASEIRTEPRGNAYGAFLSFRWQLRPSTALEPGLRWDRQTYTGAAADAPLSPRLSLRHEFGPGFDLRLSWGRYHQAQAVQQLQVEDGIEQYFPPQRADHWIAGLQRRWPGGWRLRLEAFVKDYDRLKPRFENLHDALALIPELEPDRVRLDPRSARARGIELTVEYRGAHELNGWATWSWSRVTDSIGGQDEPRSWDQRHALQAGLAWERAPWEIGLALSVHSGWPTTGMSLGYDAGEDEYFPIPGPRNAERLGTFATIDFRVARNYDLRRGTLTAFFEVTNASNRKNECCVDFDLDEDEAGEVFLDRSVDHWLPLIPALGVLWEF